MMLLAALLALTASAQQQGTFDGHPPEQPPAPPPPSYPYAHAPVPIARPQAWITSADYPRAANGAGGTVGFRLDIGANGRAYRCTIVASSGSKILDTQTCKLLRERARFRPALDSAGQPVPSFWHSRFRWSPPG